MSENGNFSTSRGTPPNCWQYQHGWSHPEQSKVYTCMCRHSTLILLCLTNHSAPPPLHTRPTKLSPSFPRPCSGLRGRCSLSVPSITGYQFYTKSSQHFMRFAFKLLTLSLNISHRTAAEWPQTSPEKYPSLKVRPEQPISNTLTGEPSLVLTQPHFNYLGACPCKESLKVVKYNAFVLLLSLPRTERSQTSSNRCR